MVELHVREVFLNSGNGVRISLVRDDTARSLSLVTKMRRCASN
jgi:hypothetical protein